MSDYTHSMQEAFGFLCRQSLSTYHGWKVTGDPGDLTHPVLFISHHGFGTYSDPAIYAMAATLTSFDRILPVRVLAHDINWKVGLGALMDALGCIPASRDSVAEAAEARMHVAVLPGGDYDIAKPWRERNTVSFYGRSGFARMALELGLPIVPVVTAGAAEGAYVISNGAGIARALRLNKLIRFNVAPVSLSVPWGLSVGGMLPYLPMPTRLESRVLPQMPALPGEEPGDYALRVERAMQDAMDEMVGRRGRLPLGFGRRRTS